MKLYTSSDPLGCTVVYPSNPFGGDCEVMAVWYAPPGTLFLELPSPPKRSSWRTTAKVMAEGRVGWVYRFSLREIA